MVVSGASGRERPKSYSPAAKPHQCPYEKKEKKYIYVYIYIIYIMYIYMYKYPIGHGCPS